MEGTSREVFTLARHFKARYIIGLSNQQNFRFRMKERAVGFPTKAYPALKLGLPIIERMSDITHIYDALGCWHYLSNLGRRPAVLTAVTGREPLALHFYDHVSAIVVDSEPRYQEMLALGFPPEKLKVIYPGVDTDYFKPADPPPALAPFKVLFATAPPTVSELEGRGVWQILQAAQQLLDCQFILLWRPWGDALSVVRQRIAEMNLANVSLRTGLVEDMRHEYQQAQCVLAPFRANGGKSCPTSVLEACACGLPVVAGEGVGIRDLLIETGAGLFSGQTPAELVAALQCLRANRDAMSKASRRLAVELFGATSFVNAYRAVYEQILNRC